jgi:hypothetical protein
MELGMLSEPDVLILMYFVIPVWFAAGFADWLCHRSSNIETTSGIKESWIHIIMFAEVGIPLLTALFLEINAAVIALMIGMFVVHEATAMWDVSYACTARRISPLEQLVHSFLEIIPLMAIGCVVSVHWDQFLALFGAGSEKAIFSFMWKHQMLPILYISSTMTTILLFEFLPYAEEYFRCLLARRSGLCAARNPRQ